MTAKEDTATSRVQAFWLNLVPIFKPGTPKSQLPKEPTIGELHDELKQELEKLTPDLNLTKIDSLVYQLSGLVADQIQEQATHGAWELSTEALWDAAEQLIKLGNMRHALKRYVPIMEKVHRVVIEKFIAIYPGLFTLQTYPCLPHLLYWLRFRENLENVKPHHRKIIVDFTEHTSGIIMAEKLSQHLRENLAIAIINVSELDLPSNLPLLSILIKNEITEAVLPLTERIVEILAPYQPTVEIPNDRTRAAEEVRLKIQQAIASGDMSPLIRDITKISAVHFKNQSQPLHLYQMLGTMSLLAPAFRRAKLSQPS